MTTYKVTAERDGRVWFIDVPVINRSTQARWASEVGMMARDLIATMTGLDDFEVSIEWKLPADAAAHLEESHRLRDEAARANARSAEQARLAARALHDAGLGSTEVGAVLGVSRQRAHQLISA